MGLNSEVAVLDAALKAAGLPIAGVSMGTIEDRSTWSVQFLKGVTPEQEAAATQLLQSVDVSAPAVDDLQTKDRLRDPFTVALVAFLAEHLKIPEAQVRDELISGLKASRGVVADVPPGPSPGVPVLQGP